MIACHSLADVSRGAAIAAASRKLQQSPRDLKVYVCCVYVCFYACVVVVVVVAVAAASDASDASDAHTAVGTAW